MKKRLRNMPPHERIKLYKEMENLRAKGYGSRRIAKTLGVSRSVILNWLRKPPKYATLKSEKEPTKEDLYDLYWNKWLNTKQIGELYGVSREKIRRLLHEFGIKPRGGRRRPNKTPDYTEEEKRLIALGIDFEGTIGIGSWGKNYIQPYVVLASTHKKLIDAWLEIVRVGNVHCNIHNSKINPKWSDGYQWRICARESVLHFLRQIEPYLIAKKEQARVLIKALKGEIPPEQAKKIIKKLNQRGR